MEPSELLSPAVLVPIVVVVVLLLGVVIGAVTMLGAKNKKKAIPKWAHGAYSIWTGGEDCGTWTQDRAATSLHSWYSVNGPGSFWKVIEGLKSGQTGNPAWDRVRALDLLRIARAATFIDDDQCWTESAKIGRELQSRYRSWEELAQAFEQGMRSWQQGRGVDDPQQTGRVQRNLPALRQQIWPAIAYTTTLPED